MTGARPNSRVDSYFRTLAALTRETEATDADGRPLALEEAVDQVRERAHAAHDRGGKLMFIGNGGSAAIASHLANDFSKNGGLRAVAFNDPAALTCHSNDFGYENVFAKQLELHTRPGDLLLALSSSGRSPNILAAARTARACTAGVITFSGFAIGNDLRRLGDINFYVRSSEYGFVEIAHLSLGHAILDLDRGWGAQPAGALRN
jgi:D-sedoheptulose 7-phosphate isomerase